MSQRINVSDFDLAGTLECGQAFRWQRVADGWHTGVVGHQVWQLRQDGDVVEAAVTGGNQPDKKPTGTAATTTAISRYLALDVPLARIVATFPDDLALREAVLKHWGLRVLRQSPWETLASFIASSSKQILQIRQIVAELARRFGVEIGDGQFAFPGVEAIAQTSHQQLWDCKLGFRAKYLLAAARAIDRGQLRLDALPGMDYDRAMEELTQLEGVGEKIAACTLLFSCGFDQAFPIDVWIERALRRLYFDGQSRVTARQLREFTRAHFGPYAGWAQQYLFFSERSRRRQPLLDAGTQR